MNSLAAAAIYHLLFTLSAATSAQAAPTLDQYGGCTNCGATGTVTGYFHTQKFGNRWLFVDPLGNPFWMKGVYYVTGNGWVDELGSSFDARSAAKYLNGPTVWAQENRRLQSWGFNTIGPGSYRMTFPTDSEPQWPGGQQPVKMPFTTDLNGYVNPGMYCMGHGMKSLYAGLDTNIFGSYAPSGHFPDVFDPIFQSCSDSAFAADSDLAFEQSSPYFLGYFDEDTDFLNGFGAGPDFPNDPPQKWGDHLGYVALVSNPSPGGSTMYTKQQLQTFLQARYGTIAALNAAWGSNYTAFGSAGGWGTGTGLMDENGRASHTWLPQDIYVLPTTNFPASVRKDLDDFLEQISEQYFMVTRASFKKVAPNSLYFGPTNLGGAGWRVPTRCPILRAAGKYLDVVNIGTDGSQAQLDFVAQCAGDVPLAIWEGLTANPDSGRWRYLMAPAGWAKSLQTDRGSLYTSDINSLINGKVTGSGSQPYVGFMFWQFLDNSSEQANWGLVSFLDNPYDGVSAVIAKGTDQWGYPTGGEEKNYGNFIGPVTQANNSIYYYLAGLPPPPPPTSSPCDINSDGTTNVVDVQLEVNMALGIGPCTNPSGVCTVVSVQRVVNAALGGQCVSP